MPRRTHKKSRGGCVSCKRRHVKCDESRPRCVNCATADVQCQYLTAPVHGPRQPSTGSDGATQIKVTEPNAFNTSGQGTVPIASFLSPAEPRPGPSVDLDSIRLLHHWYTMTCLTLTDDPDQQELWRTTVVKHGLSHPFLLHEILAIAALHLATCIPEEKGLLTTRATELQNYAVGKFHEVEVTNETNCIAVMLFSSLLGVHLLADRSRTQGLGFSDFLDHVLRCMGLLRGVMELTLKEWTSFFQASDIAPLIRDGRPQVPYDNIPKDCRDLVELVKESDLGPSSVTAYNAAIDRLFWLFALSDVPTVHSTARWAIGWPVQLPDEYIVLLNQRRPEALIILSYYGVILHFNREAWIIGDTGARLVRAINSQLGSFWERWLAWPLQITQLS